MPRRPTVVVAALLAAVVSLPAAGPVPTAKAPSDPHLNALVRPFVARHCLGCHSGPKPKGDFRLDRLSADFADRANRDRWRAVVEQLKAGTMPPKARPRPAEAHVQTVVRWVSGRAIAADNARRAAQGRVPLRRLNRVEYENTVRDLLGIQIDLKELLPEDGSSDGFDNVADALHTSSFLMEKYLEAADAALSRAIASGPRPPLIRKRFPAKEERAIKTATERVYLPREDGVVLFSSSHWNAIHLWGFYPPDRGRYRFRIAAAGHQSGGKPVTYRVDAGRMGMAGKSHLVGHIDAPPDRVKVFEFIDELEAHSTIRILPYGLANAQTVHKIGADRYTGPGLDLKYVEVEGPLHDDWPPASHRRLFGDLPQAKKVPADWRAPLEVVSKRPMADAERILRAFARRAFRRAVSDADLAPYLGLVRRKLDEKRTFEQAVRVGLTAVMVSPNFLFLREKPGTLDDFALASRLSYFLWSSMPDDELLALAEKGKLRQAEVLRAQVERMLKSPKASMFTENFVGQWLGLRDIDFTVPSHILYPEYDDLLKVSMVQETHRFFEEVLKDDLSLTNFVASDFSMLNARLAKHYGIPGVDGWEVRKVKLPPGSHRGGVLTMGSVLKVTANGTSTSPVVRGAWVLDRILGTPPPRPPAGVPAVEPDIRGATTMREQLAKHRDTPACATCHVHIDPPGFALESFDVIGGWRDHYRTSGRGKPVMIDGRRMHYLQGPKVDPADRLPNGRAFKDIDELKQLLLRDRDQLARSLTEKLLTYATGGPPEAADRAEVEAIVRRVRERKYGFRSLIEEVVQSKVFRTK